MSGKPEGESVCGEGYEFRPLLLAFSIVWFLISVAMIGVGAWLVDTVTSSEPAKKEGLSFLNPYGTPGYIGQKFALKVPDRSNEPPPPESTKFITHRDPVKVPVGAVLITFGCLSLILWWATERDFCPPVKK